MREGFDYFEEQSDKDDLEFLREGPPEDEKMFLEGDDVYEEVLKEEQQVSRNSPKRTCGSRPEWSCSARPAPR